MAAFRNKSGSKPIGFFLLFGRIVGQQEQPARRNIDVCREMIKKDMRDTVLPVTFVSG
jgi:hypothetical protein